MLFKSNEKVDSQKMKVKVLKVNPINFEFLAEDKKYNIIDGFGELLNSLQIPIQFLCKTEKVQFNDYEKLGGWNIPISLRNRIKKENGNAKNFYIIIKDYNEYQLNSTINIIENYLSDNGMRCDSNITALELDKLGIREIKRNYIKKEGYYKTLRISDWPDTCEGGWLNKLYNSKSNIDISSFIIPKNKLFAIKYLTKKIGTLEMSNEMEYKVSGDDQAYAAELESAELMLEQLRDNEANFFFMSYYITVKADTVEELDQEYANIVSFLRGKGISTKCCFLREYDGYRNSLPECQDHFENNLFDDNKYNFTTNSLKCFFPFTADNIADPLGFFLGTNEITKSFILLDIFAQQNYSVLEMGSSGAGKTYVAQLSAIRMSHQKIHVTIFDRRGDFLPIQFFADNKYLKIYNFQHLNDYLILLKNYVNEMEANFKNGDATEKHILIIDEFWEFFRPDFKYRDEFSALLKTVILKSRACLRGVWLITQQIEDMLAEVAGQTILNIAETKFLMHMTERALDKVEIELHLSDKQKRFLEYTEHGGILIAGKKQVQFKALASEEETLKLTTNQLLKMEHKKVS